MVDDEREILVIARQLAFNRSSTLRYEYIDNFEGMTDDQQREWMMELVSLYTIRNRIDARLKAISLTNKEERQAAHEQLIIDQHVAKLAKQKRPKKAAKKALPKINTTKTVVPKIKKVATPNRTLDFVERSPCACGKKFSFGDELTAKAVAAAIGFRRRQIVMWTYKCRLVPETWHMTSHAPRKRM